MQIPSSSRRFLERRCGNFRRITSCGTTIMAGRMKRQQWPARSGMQKTSSARDLNSLCEPMALLASARWLAGELGPLTAPDYAKILADDPGIGGLGQSNCHLQVMTACAAHIEPHIPLSQVVNLKNSGAKILIFVDDSAEFNLRNLDYTSGPRIPARAIAAMESIRQASIAQALESFFSRHDIISAQIIVDRAYICTSENQFNLSKIINFLFARNAVPILIENFLHKSLKNECSTSIYDAALQIMMDI